MNLKKNTISYIAWLFLLFFTGATCAFLGLLLSQAVRINMFIVAIGLITAFLALVFLIYYLTGVILRHKVKKHNFWSLLNLTDTFEKILLVTILGIGLVIRILFLSHAGEDAAFYEVAKVTGESGIMIQPVQGIVYFYCIILHGLFYIFGNKWIIGIWLQIVLQLCASVFLYYSIRNLISRVAALIGLGIVMFSPYSILSGVRYSPVILYFCMFSITLFLLSDYMKRSILNEENSIFMWCYSVIVGIVIGLCCYGDISGVGLFILLLCLPKIQRESNGILWWKRTATTAISAIIVFFLLIILDSILSNSTFLNIIEALKILYKSENINLGQWTDEIDFGFILLIAVSCIGCFSFWRRTDGERFTPYIFMIVFQSILIFTGITTKNMNGYYFLFILLVILATVSITELFYKENIKDNDETKEMEKEVLEGQEINKIEYIENPLPVPKKHIKKTMDYAFVPEDSMMKYDILVSEKDDFDIK